MGFVACTDVPDYTSPIKVHACILRCRGVCCIARICVSMIVFAVGSMMALDLGSMTVYLLLMFD